MRKYRVVHYTETSEPNFSKRFDYSFEEAFTIINRGGQWIYPGEEFKIQKWTGSSWEELTDLKKQNGRNKV